MIRISAAVIMIVGAGLVHGYWTNRWGASAALTALGARFESVPMVIGDWKATTFELTAGERAMAGAVACLGRVYTNSSRGLSVQVLLLGGLPGKISTHTPDVCYRGSGYTLDTPSPFRRQYGPADQPAEFNTMVATQEGTNPSVLRIFWSWNAGKGWSAPGAPRWTFATAPALCKLYVIRETAGAVVNPGADPCNDFLNVLLPELDKVVFSAPK
jgi:hypothetical protein